jgi:regulator of extracellular matrix RemA (YlzA/DUF370 family)
VKLVNIGFNNFLNLDRILTVLQPDSQPVKRLMADAKNGGNLIDATQGRKTTAVILLDSGHAVLSYLQPETLRIHAETDE